MSVRTTTIYRFSRQRYVWQRSTLAMIVGLFCALASLLVSYQQLRHDAAQQQQTIIQQLQAYFDNQRAVHHRWQTDLLALSRSACAQIQSQLQEAATQGQDVRSVLVMQQGKIACSSSTPEETRMLLPHIKALQQQPYTPMLVQDPRTNTPIVVYWWPNKGQTDHGILYVQNTQILTRLLLRAHPPFITALSMTFHSPDPVLLSSFVTPSTPAIAPITTQQEIEKNITLNVSSLTGWQLVPLLSGVQMVLALLLGVCASLLTGLLYNDRLYFRHALHTQIRDNKLRMHYQPLIDCQSGRIIGVEALLRWTPYGLTQAPFSLLEELEQLHLMPDLTHHLMQLITQDMQQLPLDTLPNGFRVSINISPDHLSDPSLISRTRTLREQLPAHTRVVLEITERQPLCFNPRQVQHLDLLQTLPDVHLALDDFGTGHNSLAYLNQLRPDYIKIDKHFTACIDAQQKDTVILDSIIMLAQRLGIALIAEGVESGTQAQYLQQKGVQTLQGFLFARPMCIDELKTWLQNPVQKFAATRSMSLESMS